MQGDNSQILMPARSKNSEKNIYAFNTIFARSIPRLQVFTGSPQELPICRHAHIKFQIGCKFEILSDSLFKQNTPLEYTRYYKY